MNRARAVSERSEVAQFSAHKPDRNNILNFNPGGIPDSANSNLSFGSRSSSRKIELPEEEAKIYLKPEYDDSNEKSKVYKENKERAKERTFNDYNKFDIKNFDVKTDGSLVQYKPEFHKNAVVSNVTFW